LYAFFHHGQNALSQSFSGLETSWPTKPLHRISLPVGEDGDTSFTCFPLPSSNSFPFPSSLVFFVALGIDTVSNCHLAPLLRFFLFSIDLSMIQMVGFSITVFFFYFSKVLTQPTVWIGSHQVASFFVIAYFCPSSL